MKFNEIKVPEDMKFFDISSERWRRYHFPKTKETVYIDFPVALNVSASSGGHRIIDRDGVSHYIHSDWNHISWESNPHFSF